MKGADHDTLLMSVNDPCKGMPCLLMMGGFVKQVLILTHENSSERSCPVE